MGEAERKHEIVLGIGPITSDMVFEKCIGRIDEIRTLIEKADETFDRAIKAGSYYDLRGTADDGMAHSDDLNSRLDDQEARLVSFVTHRSVRALTRVTSTGVTPSSVANVICISSSLLPINFMDLWQHEENINFRQPLKIFASKF